MEARPVSGHLQRLHEFICMTRDFMFVNGKSDIRLIFFKIRRHIQSCFGAPKICGYKLWAITITHNIAHILEAIFTHSMSSFFRPLMPFTSTTFRGFISAIRWPKRYCLNYNSINKSYKKWKSSSYTFFHATNYVGLETTRTTCVHIRQRFSVYSILFFSSSFIHTYRNAYKCYMYECAYVWLDRLYFKCSMRPSYFRSYVHVKLPTTHYG